MLIADSPGAPVSSAGAADDVTRVLLSFAAGTALLLASFANFLSHNEYSWWRPEVGIVVAAIILITAAIVPLYVGQRQWGRSLLEGVLVLLFADLNDVSLPFACLAGLATSLFSWWRRKSLVGPLALFGAVVLLTTAAGLGEREEWFHTEARTVPVSRVSARPGFAVLHLLLDEQAGVQGIYPDAEGMRFRKEMREFFHARGFTLYGRAYSEHMHTRNAIPAILNFGTHQGTASRRGVRVGRTVYFSKLAEAGFKIHVLQNDFADLCADNPVASCTTYDSSSLLPTLEVPLDTSERAKLIALKFIAISKLNAMFWRGLEISGALAGLPGTMWPRFDPRNSSHTSTIAAAVALREWSRTLQKARPGDVYFAHLLLPHYPRVFHEDCTYRKWSEWDQKVGEDPIDEQRRKYVQQDRCTLRMINGLIREFEQSRGGHNGAIIVHGDHGSRIWEVPPVTNLAHKFTADDVIAAHSTLFAVRSPQTKVRYDETPQAITHLLRAFMAADFAQDPVPAISGPYSYVMTDGRGRPRQRAELPRNW